MELLVVLLGTPKAVLLMEDFEGASPGSLPSGWTVVDGNADDTTWTVVSEADEDDDPPNCGSQYARFDDDDWGYGYDDTLEVLVSPAVYVGGLSNLFLTYSYNYNDYSVADDTAWVGVSIFAGGSWTDQILVQWTSDTLGTDTINLSSYLPAESVKVFFGYDDGQAWAMRFSVDNVSLYSISAAPDPLYAGFLGPGSADPMSVESPISPRILVANAGGSEVPAESLTIAWSVWREGVDSLTGGTYVVPFPIPPTTTIPVVIPADFDPLAYYPGDTVDGINYEWHFALVYSGDADPSNNSGVDTTTSEIVHHGYTSYYAWYTSWYRGPDGTVPFTWYDESFTQLFTTGADDEESWVSLPWSVDFFGAAYDSINVGVNGGADFLAGDIATGNEALPSSSQSAFLALLWDDLRIYASDGSIGYWTGGDSLFVIRYYKVSKYNHSSPDSVLLDGEIIFANVGQPGIGGGDATDIYLSYRFVNNDLLVSGATDYTVGIQSGDTMAIQFCYDGEPRPIVADSINQFFTIYFKYLGIVGTLASPTQISPDSGAELTTSSVEFVWSSVESISGTTHYVIQVYEDTTASPLYEDDITDTSITYAFLSDGTYYWRVRAYDDGGNYSQWTGFWPFTLNTTDVAGVPLHWGLSFLSPNPAKGRVDLLLAVPRPEPYTLKLYDAAGRLVMDLSGVKEPGFHRIAIAPKSSGFYLLVFDSPEVSLKRKLLIR